MSTESTCSENVSTGAVYIDMTFDPGRPFNDLPNLPPASETETKTILRSCIAARAALSELRVSGRFIPNQAMLINSIPCSKLRRVPRSKTSSRRRTDRSAMPATWQVKLTLPPERLCATAPPCTAVSRGCDFRMATGFLAHALYVDVMNQDVVYRCRFIGMS